MSTTDAALAKAFAEHADEALELTRIPPLVCVRQTSIACPSQWDAWDADNRYYYLRYRCAHGTVQAVHGPTPDSSHEEFIEAVGIAPVIAEFWHGGQYAGDMELDEFLRRAGMELA